MLNLLFRLVAALPLRVVHALGGVLGRLVFLASPSYRRCLVQNLAQAGYTDPALVRRAAAEAGRQGLETPWIWMRSSADVLARTIVEDPGAFDRLLADGRPVLVLTPHIGCFEIVPRYYGERVAQAAERPMTVVYRVPRKAVLRDIVKTGRAARNIKLAPAELSGVRMVLRAMQAREVVGILPDQVPSRGDGVWAPFFGRWAYTMTLPARLARQNDAVVVLVWGERLPRGEGWRLRVSPFDSPLSGDAAADATAINRGVERVIRNCPEQYLWGYNRYKAPSGAPPVPSGAP